MPGKRAEPEMIEAPCMCGHRMVLSTSDAAKAKDRPIYCSCPSCAARVVIDPNNVIHIQVGGKDSNEVLAVTRGLANDALARRELIKLRRSPWFSGLFYMTLLALVIALMLTAGSILPIWTLPIVIVGAILLVSIVGAFQLRQDERLSERGFSG